MSEWELLLQGFIIALEWKNLVVVAAACFIGTVIGMLPGIGPINAIAIIFPITFSLGLPVTSVMILFAGIYYGSQYGNSISSILINIPGTSSAAATAIEGYALTKRGKAGQALSMSAIASFFGGTVSIFFLMIFAAWLSKLAIRFGPAEYFVLMVFAFTAISGLSGEGGAIKGMVSALLGIALSTVGTDFQTGSERLTFGLPHLLDGISFIVVVIGFYGIGEVIELIAGSLDEQKPETQIGRLWLSLKELKRNFMPMLRSCISGFFVGVLPGAGATIASFIAYNVEKKMAVKDNEFGRGDLRGVAAPESANNSSAVGAFIPLLVLGVPGSETTAVMLGSLLSFGVAPGPLFLTQSADVFWTLVASMFFGNLVLLVLNLPLVSVFVKILMIPQKVLIPIVVSLSFVGVYSISGSYFDILLTVIFGIFGFFMRRMSFPLPPLILGLVLGGLMETNMRRALAYSQGDYSIFFSSSITWFFWLLVVGSFALPRILKKFSKT